MAAVTVTALKFAATAAAAGTIWIQLCGSYTPAAGNNGGTVGVAHTVLPSSGITAPFDCPAGSGAGWQGLDVLGSGTASNGTRGMWEIDAPAGFSIVHFWTDGSGMSSYGVNSGGPWGGGWYWQGGGAEVHAGEAGYSSPTLATPYIGWQVICGQSTCNGINNAAQIAVLGLGIEATEPGGPTLTATPGSLGAASGWVRGTWPVAFSADGPTGACEMDATLNGIAVSEPLVQPANDTTWHQCPAGSFDQPYNTASAPSQAGVPLSMWAQDAAWDYSTNTPIRGDENLSVNIDNDPVTVSLTGPSSALSTAGTQYVTATGTAGPSGVSAITCSVDGASPQTYPGATARVPVSGVGEHTVSCYAANNARDTAGAVATSATESWTLDIQQPTVSSIGFAKVLDPMRCHKRAELIEIAGHWARIRARHGRKGVRRFVRAHRARERVTVCHPRIVKERVAVWRTVIRHHHKARVRRYETRRVAVDPHLKMLSRRRVGFAKTTTVSGWLGSATGVALGGQSVTVMGAVDNGTGQFRAIATAITAPNGTWSARIPKGPSRLIQATYSGNSAFAPTSSAQVREVVPARVKLLSVTPAAVPWGATVTIRGRLEGGYLPAAGELVRLRIGYRTAYTTYGIEEHVTGHGYFHTTYTFGAGDPSVLRAYWFQIASLPVGDYPYQPAASRKVTVRVGGDPPAPRRHRHGHQHRRRT
ncbi:hypothetical protein [Conexibacter sp. DBS9H8]|uniref:hypothetical protein n=1 Tax=Conexibacter sp. DBS9H8 TaxID=2937801 RepID=UPI00200CBC56|nr:hypothetical protein [Conexibacter sp. DBS9H8]